VQFTTSGRFSNASNPKFSPDGNWVAFEGWQGGEGRPNIYVARIDGSGLQQVSDGEEERHPTWTPGGEVVYSEFVDGGLWRTVKESLSTGETTVLASRLVSADQAAFRQAAYWQLGFRTPTPQPIP
jgi:Tol biopolymer transport system component